VKALAACILLALAATGCGSPRVNTATSPSGTSPVACTVTATPSYAPRSPSPPAYGDQVLVSQGQTVTRPFTVFPSLLEVAVQSSWNSGDIQIRLISPSERVVDRTTDAPDVLHPGTINSLTLVVKHPEAGQWTIQIFGASVPGSGGRVGFGVIQIPQSDFAPITYVSATPDRGVAPVSIQFDGTASGFSGATIASYRWNFGDCSPSATTAKTTHVFTSAGNYAVSVTVTDSNGQTDTADREILVTAYNHVPTASFLWGLLDRSKPTQLGFSAQPSNDIDGEITSYAWTFGDGTSGNGEVPSHTYATVGAYRVTLTVTDNGGLTAMACQVVTTGTTVGPTTPCVARAVPASDTPTYAISIYDSTGSLYHQAGTTAQQIPLGEATSSSTASETNLLPVIGGEEVHRPYRCLIRTATLSA